MGVKEGDAMSKLRKALEKAKDARREDRENPYAFENVAVDTSRRHSPSHIDTASIVNELRPLVPDPQIKHLDFRNMERNRIISVCHGNTIADRIKILRTQIMHTMNERNENTLLIASAKNKEGRTTTAINLGIALSQQIDRTILLVDADLRNPSIHTLLGFDVEKGLAHFLKGEASLSDIIIDPRIPRLNIIPGGGPIENSSELLDTEPMKMLFRQIKERCGHLFVIFDSPPLLTSADSLVLARYVDGIIIVVESEKTRKDELARVIELLKGRPIIGTVLNKVRD